MRASIYSWWTSAAFQHCLLWPVLAILPRRLGYALADRYAGLLWASDFHLRPWRVTQWRAALSRCFPGQALSAIDDLGRAHARMICRDTLDTYRLSQSHQKQVPHDVGQRSGDFSDYRLVGREFLDQAAARGQGVILVIAHFDRFFALAPGLGRQGYPFAMLTTPIDRRNPEYADRHVHGYWTEKMRKTTAQSLGQWVTTQDSIRAVHRLLAEGKTVLVAFDGNESVGPRVGFDFFQTQLALPQGLMRILAASGAAAVYGSVHTDCEKSHRVEIRIRPLPQQPDQVMACAIRYLQEDLRVSPWAWWQWRSLSALEQIGKAASDPLEK